MPLTNLLAYSRCLIWRRAPCLILPLAMKEARSQAMAQPLMWVDRRRYPLQPLVTQVCLTCQINEELHCICYAVSSFHLLAALSRQLSMLAWLQVGQQSMLQQGALSAQTVTNKAAWAISMRWPCKQRPLTRRWVIPSPPRHGSSCAMAMLVLWPVPSQSLSCMHLANALTMVHMAAGTGSSGTSCLPATRAHPQQLRAKSAPHAGIAAERHAAATVPAATSDIWKLQHSRRSGAIQGSRGAADALSTTLRLLWQTICWVRHIMSKIQPVGTMCLYYGCCTVHARARVSPLTASESLHCPRRATCSSDDITGYLQYVLVSPSACL